MPGKSTTDAIFALRILAEKYREKQRELHCIFIDLEKAYDWVPREEVRLCLREKGSVRNVGQGCAGHVSRKYDSSEKC